MNKFWVEIPKNKPYHEHIEELELAGYQLGENNKAFILTREIPYLSFWDDILTGVWGHRDNIPPDHKHEFYKKVLLDGPSGAFVLDPFTHKLVLRGRLVIDPGQTTGVVYGDSVVNQIRPVHDCCLSGHSFVDTGTSKSWCEHCNTDAHWDSTTCNWKVS